MKCSECNKNEAISHECYDCYINGWMKQKPKILNKVYNKALEDIDDLINHGGSFTYEELNNILVRLANKETGRIKEIKGEEK